MAILIVYFYSIIVTTLLVEYILSGKVAEQYKLTCIKQKFYSIKLYSLPWDNKNHSFMTGYLIEQVRDLDLIFTFTQNFIDELIECEK